MLVLRNYQQEAIDVLYRYLREYERNPCIVIPTGGGKTPVIATICKDAVTTWGGRVLILAHVKELLEQSAEKLLDVCPEVGFGIYSASLKRRDKHYSVIIAGIQSVYKRACEMDRFDLILVDEAHLIPEEGDGMYRQFLADAKIVNPAVRVVGLTATPYRLKSGIICGPDNILNDICYEIGVKELIRDGYLCPLISKRAKNVANTSGLHIRAGEFINEEVAKLMNDEPRVAEACDELVAATMERRGVIIFASGVDHGATICRMLKWNHGIDCGFVYGDMPADDRADTIAKFKRQEIKYLCNVQVLTLGFDAPHVDCVVLLRPTLSPGLYYQMVGRGFRLFPGKANCLVLDFGGNILRHGPVDQIKVRTLAGGGGGEAPAKDCPQCRSVISTGYAKCPDCGYEFPAPERQGHDGQASKAGVLSGQITDEKYTVEEVSYAIHKKRGADDDAPKTLRVEYRVGFHVFQREWVCFEHEGFAGGKASQWWARRSKSPRPGSSQEALNFINEVGILEPTEITVRSVAGEQFDRIIGYELPPIENAVDLPSMVEEEVPF